MACTACGTENRPGSRFCDSCGTPLQAACPACGETNRADARFCSSCGTTLASAQRTNPGTGPGTSPGSGAPAVTTGTSAGPEAATAERRLVTVLFADLVGFTTLAEDRDPEAVRELLTRYFDAATEIVQMHGGTVEKFIGDAVMAVWGTPIAHEDDAERAVRAALELVSEVNALHPELRARAGVLTGDAAVTLGATNQGMVAGDLVNTAARLQGVAEAGTVLVGEATRQASENAIVFEPIGDRSLKGKIAPVPAWQAVRVVAARGGQGRADALEPPFVGREEELRQLKEVLHAVGRDRKPRLVSITGPGGIGKSRLVWELEKYVDGVSDPIYWHSGRSPSYGEGITFWALGEMVRRRARLTEDDDDATTRERVAAAMDEYVADAGDRERIGPALLSLLGVEEAPPGGRDALFPAWRLFFERIAEKATTVLVFEDLQWADSGLLDFIDHLLDWSRGLPIIVVTLARPELFDRRPDWGAGRRQLTALALEPLADAEIRGMLDGMVPGLPEDALAAIVGRSEGIPLYAVETVRGLLADELIERRGDSYVPVGDLSRIRVPDSLRSLIASRLDGLEAADRTLLQDASVLGQVFSADALAAITGLDLAALEPRLQGLVRRELVDVEADPRSPERGRYRFVQSLIREVAYGTLARRDRRSRHIAVARHYEAIGDDELAGALASHYLAAHQATDEGPEADAIAAQARLALGAAAQRAATLGAHHQAIAFLEQALAITTDPRERAPLLDRAATSATATATPDAQRYAQGAIDACRQIGDDAAAAAATVRFGRVLLNASEIAHATEVLEAAIPAVEALDDPGLLGEAFAHLARAHMRSGQPEKAVAAADRALEIGERLELDPVVAEALVNKGSALVILGRRREAVALLGAALELVVRIGDRGLEMRIRNNYASALSDDEPARSTALLEETLSLAGDLGDRGMYIWVAGTLAMHLRAEGRRWDEHLAVLRDALETARLTHDRLRMRQFIGAFEGPRGENFRTVTDELREILGDSDDPDDRQAILYSMAFVAQHTGRHEESYRAAIAAMELPSQSPESAADLGLTVAIWGENPDRIADMARRVLDLPRAGSRIRALKETAAAALAAVEGRTDEAAAGFRRAHRQLDDELGLRFDAARCAVDAAILLPAHPEVRAMAARSRPVLEQLGARPYLDRLDAALGEPTAPTRTTAAAAAAEVT